MILTKKLMLGIYQLLSNQDRPLAADEDFAQFALTYPQLIDRIIRLGLKTVRD